MAMKELFDVEDVTQQDLVDEEVFKKAFIPRNLDEVIDFERDAMKAQDGTSEDVYYPMVTGLKPDLSGAKEHPSILDTERGDENKMEEIEDENMSDEASSAESNNEDTGSGNEIKTEEEMSRKEHKKIVKEQNRERRKNKMPKHVKKRREKIGKTRKPKK
eukprot:gene6788-12359_t